MIAQSRQTDALYNINNTISAEAQENESIELSLKMSKSNSSKLSSNVLQELEEPKQKTVHFQISGAADYFEIDQSCKTTEYSVNPLQKEKAGILKKSSS